MYCRKNFTDLTVDERNRLADALNAIHTQGVIAEHTHHHEHYFDNGIHRGPAFLPWHRHMIILIERALRNVDARVTLPYWDWTRADSRDLDVEPWKSFFGGRNNTGGKFDHWSYNRAPDGAGWVLPTLDEVLGELQAGTFANFRSMEFGSHVPGHTWTGGTMAGTGSPGDPLFYIHHCNVDRLWAIWQRNHPGVAQYTLDDCAGCLRIDSTFVALNDAMVGGATPASMLDHTALGYFYHDDEALEARAIETGLAPIVSGDVVDISLETPQVIFNDVPEGDTTKRAALFKIEGCATFSFEVTDGPTGPFTLFAPGPFPYPAGLLSSDELRIWIMFTGQAAGSVGAGVISILARNEFGDEVARWEDIPIFANSVSRPTVALALVLDESGSMLAGAGNNRTRLQVLQLAATTLIDQLFDDNGLAMVSFAEGSAKLMDLQTAGVINSTERTTARSEIISHGPPDVYQHTCIGAGLQEAVNIYNTSPLAADFDIKATVVFTDGFEDRTPYIRDVAHLINERVYAVGVGDAGNVRNDILRAIAENSGGYMLVTGAIPQDDEFILEKFFIQILAGVTNRDIIRDPDGWLMGDQVAKVDFSVTKSDIAFDSIALSRIPQYITVGLETPDGTVVWQNEIAGGMFRLGSSTSSFRVTLPLVVNGLGHWEGKWKMLLKIQSKKRIPSFLLQSSKLPALRYHVVVHTRSNLKLAASYTQDSLTPGSKIFLRAIISEYGEPIETRPQVSAFMTRPDHSTQWLTLTEIFPGEFNTTVTAIIPGVYRFLVHASGTSSAGQSFTREQLLTAIVGRTEHEGPTQSTDPGKDIFCKLLHCLTAKGVLNKQALQKFKEMGIDMAELQKCLEAVCKSKGNNK